MELQLFDAVAEACRTMSPPDLGEVRVRSHRYGVKAWFGPQKPPRLHYEAQVVGARHVVGASVLAVEVGFHAEDPDPSVNDDAVRRLTDAERRWRRTLGDDVVVGPFLGRPDVWKRVSETWLDPDLDDADLVLDLSSRLVDYFVCFEPELRGRKAG